MKSPIHPLAILSALGLLGTTSYGMASPIALNCDRSANDQTRLIRVSAHQYQIYNSITETNGLTNKPFTQTHVEPLVLLGTEEGAANAELVSPRSSGQSYLTFQTAVATDGTYSIYYNDSFGGGNANCKPGDAFQAFKNDLAKGATISTETYRDYQDSSLALKCTSETAVTYKIRAIKDSFAAVDTQVIPSNDANQFGTDLDAFIQTPTGIEASIESGSTQYPPVATTSYLTVEKKRNSHGKYDAEFSDGTAIHKLSCDPYWGFGHFWTAIQEQNEKAKALPTPGISSDVNLNLTADQVQQVMNLYGDLIMKIPGISGTGVSVYRKEDPKSPYGSKQDVWYLDIMVIHQSDLEPVKATLGESLKGALLQYEVTGVAVVD